MCGGGGWGWGGGYPGSGGGDHSSDMSEGHEDTP